jgi:hypothetical protein
MARATTVRFTDEMFAKLDQASARTGLPVNSIVIAACLDWMQRHTPDPAGVGLSSEHMFSSEDLRLLRQSSVAPRWATLSRAVKLATAKRPRTGTYPFERFTERAKVLLTRAQEEAEGMGHSYIGTEHLLIAAFGSDNFSSARILGGLNIDVDAARSAIEGELGKPAVAKRSQMIPTSRVKRVIEIAFERCGAMNDPRVGTGHILLALAVEGHGIAAHVLKELGATPELIQSQMANLAEPET